MKIFALTLSLLISFSPRVLAMGLSFSEPNLQVKKVTIRKPLQTNLIRLYLKLPSEMRMIAGYKEIKSPHKVIQL